MCIRDRLDSEDGASGGLSTLTIDIPVEAREKMLQMTRKSIFEQGKGCLLYTSGVCTGQERLSRA